MKTLYLLLLGLFGLFAHQTDMTSTSSISIINDIPNDIATTTITYTLKKKGSATTSEPSATIVYVPVVKYVTVPATTTIVVYATATPPAIPVVQSPPPEPVFDCPTGYTCMNGDNPPVSNDPPPVESYIDNSHIDVQGGTSTQAYAGENQWITVTVHGKDGNILPGNPVTAYVAGHPFFKGQTDVNGQFLLSTSDIEKAGRSKTVSGTIYADGIPHQGQFSVIYNTPVPTTLSVAMNGSDGNATTTVNARETVTFVLTVSDQDGNPYTGLESSTGEASMIAPNASISGINILNGKGTFDYTPTDPGSQTIQITCGGQTSNETLIVQ